MTTTTAIDIGPFNHLLRETPQPLPRWKLYISAIPTIGMPPALYFMESINRNIVRLANRVNGITTNLLTQLNPPREIETAGHFVTRIDTRIAKSGCSNEPVCLYFPTETRYQLPRSDEIATEIKELKEEYKQKEKDKNALYKSIIVNAVGSLIFTVVILVSSIHSKK